MNRVLEYSARHGRRGTAYGTASMMMAGVVLAVPFALLMANTALQYIISQPRPWVPLFDTRIFIVDGPIVLIFGLPVLGLILGTLGLALRCKQNTLVILGILVNISGIIAAVGALWLKG